ncbi:MAG TPA: hypothetical protein VF752_03440 [Thermoleophilaceae bacterium]
MHQMRHIKSHTPAGMTAPTYRINRPRRHSAIRRFAGYGIVR